MIAILCLLTLLFMAGLSSSHGESKCIEGSYHKESPSAEGPRYAECFSWKEKSCCTANFTIELSKNRVENLYNLTWNHCASLSQECERFIKNEECFYQCEPSLIKWHTKEGAVDRVPICANYCDDWFDACKADTTCVQSWFDFEGPQNTCPANSTCNTFEKIYKDGKGLCNTMWGSSFKYEESKNCMVMEFNGTNPNTAVKPPEDTTSPAPTSTAPTRPKGPVLMIFLSMLLSTAIFLVS